MSPFTIPQLRRPRRSAILSSLAVLILLAAVARVMAEVPAEGVGKIERLAKPFHPHWVWVTDLVLERAALVDLDQGRFLGIVNGGYGTVMPLFPKRRDEIYVPATYYDRRTRGERTDVLEIYDASTLSFAAEVVLPAKRATNAVALGHASISDDDRYVAVFNWTTGTSLSIIDAEKRVFTGEISTPGCSLAYAAGPRRFFSLCGDGSVFVVTLDDEGKEAHRVRTQPFVDPHADPVTEKAVRYRDQWLFVSFDGRVHPIDVSGAEIAFGEPWSLCTEAERAATWKIGGLQHLAVHEKTGRLYSLVHRGGPDTHKEPGEEIWVYDLATRRRVERIELVNPGVTIYGFAIEPGRSWVWPFNRLFDWALDTFAPASVGQIQVTQDDQPLLFTASQFSGSVGVYDALTGDFVRRVQPVGWTSDVLLAPWGRE
jgi:methylamine dehydrogenase heavy chain